MRSLYGLTIGSGCSCVGMRLMFANDANVRLEGVGWAYHKWNKMCQLWELLWKLLREHFGGNHCYQPTSFRKEINHMTQTTAGTVFFLVPHVPHLLTSQDSHAEALPMAQQALRSTQKRASSQTVSSSAVTRPQYNICNLLISFIYFYMVIKGSFCWSWCRLISWLSNISCSSVCASRLLGLTLPCFVALHP